MATNSTIAVVDDDGAVREALKGLLRSAGFRVELFSSAEEFLNSGQIEDISCVVLDVRMPGMSGVELQERLNGSRVAIPIIFMTAHGDASVRARALQGGAIDFLQKPFTDEALLNALARGLGRPSP